MGKLILFRLYLLAYFLSHLHIYLLYLLYILILSIFYYPAEDASPKKLYSVCIEAEDVPKVLEDELYRLSNNLVNKLI